MIEISYVLTIDDLVEAGTEAYGRGQSTLRYRLEWAVVGVGLVAIVLTQKPSPLYWLIIFGLFFIWNAVKPSRSHLKSHFQKSVTGEQVVAQIGENSIDTESVTAHVVAKWEGITRVIETPNTFSLVTNANSIYVLPKRVFSEQSLKEFQQLIAQKGIPNKPR